ncbi:MAG: alkaline phosphatase PhoX [Sphingosinicella sp.]|uniref:alkaline phosphatase PhoX n=1 Tax=Sphingosinicella sp. TaxID=1917971 RepID=UPI00403842DD
MNLSRRSFLAAAHGAALFYGTGHLGALAAASTNARLPLRADPQRMLDLPEGFSYRLVARSGEPMADGFVRPGRPDGMACFPVRGDASKCILLRNHENFPTSEGGSPFGEGEALLGRLDPALL